jgi:hypothetical protein
VTLPMPKRIMRKPTRIHDTRTGGGGGQSRVVHQL